VKIDRKLHLVQSLETAAGKVFIHSTPISVGLWETFFHVISLTYSEIFNEGLTVVAGPPIAKMLLRRAAERQGVLKGPDGVDEGLLPEIRRLTNVVMPGPHGWETVPYDVALDRKVFDEEDVAEIEGIIVFFICVSAVLRRPASAAKLGIILGGLKAMWGAQTSLLSATAYSASLPTLTPTALIGEKATPSSLPR
jgi:hypothetical protein